MKRVSVYPRDGIVGSSSYYRIIQYFSQMPEYCVRIRTVVPEFLTRAVYNAGGGLKGIAIKLLYHFCVYLCSIFYFVADVVCPPDCVVILRSIEPKTFRFPVRGLYESMLKRVSKCIWDIDDDIFCSNEISAGEAELLKKHADRIVVTHDYLAALLGEDCRDRIVIMPTTDGDFEKYGVASGFESRSQTYEEGFRIAWLASSSGLSDLEMIAPQLEKAAEVLQSQYGKALTLQIICNRPVMYDFSVLHVEFVCWNRDVAVKKVLQSHMGIMPLRNNLFSLGKGGFKLVQYMAAGIPSVASGVGYNRKVIRDGVNGYLVDDSVGTELWVDRIVDLATDKAKWSAMSRNAYDFWQEHFMFGKNLQKWKNLIEDGSEL